MRAASSGPGPRGWHAAIYDPVRDRMVVFGGTNGPTTFGDVWALSLGDTAAWTQLSPAGAGPGARSTLSAIYDAPRDRIVFYGGIDGTNEINKVQYEKACMPKSPCTNGNGKGKRASPPVVIFNNTPTS